MQRTVSASAETVRCIFPLSRDRACVRRVKDEADRLGLSTKRSTTAGGIERGGKPFSRGHIYNLLSNPIYIGEIAHKGQLYPGQHPALIDADTLAAALTRPAMLLERFDTAGVPGDQTSRMLDRATRFVAALNRSPAERAKVVRDLIEKVVIEEDAIMIRVRRSPLLGGAVMPPASENPGDSPIELTAPVAFRRRGVEMRLVLPRVALQNDHSRCDPTLIKAIARGRAWFEDLAAGRSPSC